MRQDGMRRSVVDIGRGGDTADGDTADGVIADGDTADGVIADGVIADGVIADGVIADGVIADGDTADGDTADETTIEERREKRNEANRRYDEQESIIQACIADLRKATEQRLWEEEQGAGRGSLEWIGHRRAELLISMRYHFYLPDDAKSAMRLMEVLLDMSAAMPFRCRNNTSFRWGNGEWDTGDSGEWDGVIRQNDDIHEFESGDTLYPPNHQIQARCNKCGWDGLIEIVGETLRDTPDTEWAGRTYRVALIFHDTSKSEAAKLIDNYLYSKSNDDRLVEERAIR